MILKRLFKSRSAAEELLPEDTLSEPLSVEEDLPSAIESVAQLAGLNASQLDAVLRDQRCTLAVREAALHQLDCDDEARATQVLGDLPRALRLVAAGLLVDEHVIDRTMRQLRGRDKGLYRQLRQHLDARLSVRQREEEIEQLCQRLERLVADPDLDPHDTRLHTLENQLQQHDLPQTIVQRIEVAKRQLHERQPESAEQRLDRLGAVAILEELDQHTIELTQLNASTAQNFESQLILVRQRLDAGQLGVDAQRVQLRLEQLEARYHALQRDAECCQAQDALLNKTLRWSKRKNGIRASDLRDLRERWQALKKPTEASLAATQQQRFDERLQQLEAILAEQGARREESLLALQNHLQAFTTALNSGEVERAEHSDQAIRQLLDQHPLPRDQWVKQAEQLSDLRQQLGQLRDWKKWGAHQARDHLIEAAEELAQGLLQPPEVARRVQKLREQWKSLDHKEGAAGKVLWERFDAACEKAYAPCIEHFKAQSEQRSKALAEREALCAQLENLIKETQGAEPAWRRIDRSRNDVLNAWRKAGAVEREQRRLIDKRWRKALRALDARLNPERSRDFARREALVEQVKALTELNDLRQAMQGAKEAQAAWQPTVLSPRKQEQELWKHFRAACDAIFARRDEQRQAVEQERGDNQRQKLDICQEIERIAALDDDAFTNSERDLNTLRQRWRSVGSVARNGAQALEQRYKAGLEAIDARRRVLEQARKRQHWLQLDDCERLCQQLEAQSMRGKAYDEAGLTAIEQQWQALEAVQQGRAGPLAERFEQAIKRHRALNAGQAVDLKALESAMKKGLKQRRQLCLQLEILAGVDSPGGDRKERMALQVSRLSATLGSGGRLAPEQELEQILLEWYLCWVLPGDDTTILDRRCKLAIENVL